MSSYQQSDSDGQNSVANFFDNHVIYNVRQKILLIVVTLYCYTNEKDYEVSYNRSSVSKCGEDIPVPEGWCPGTWDNLLCWKPAPPNGIAKQSCPKIPGFNPEHEAHKYCTPNGTWIRNYANRQWTNYSGCIDFEWIKFQSAIQKVYMSGYCTSIAALFLGLLIYQTFRTLENPRIKVHKHLFISFILTNIASLFQLQVGADARILMHNPLWCRVLTVFNIYFILCNYAWMFCEGLYLHTVLIFSIYSEKIRLLPILYAIGWGLPVIPLTVYVVLRSSCVIVRNQLDHCWTVHVPQYRWIVMSFTAFFQVGNAVFLVNILRVVFSKLRAQQHSQASAHEVRLVKGSLKALIILIPLLGVYYIVMTAYRPEGNFTATVIAYQSIYAIATSLQGFLVAIVICFMNEEVHTAVTLRFHQWLSRHTTNLGPRPSQFNIDQDQNSSLLPRRGHGIPQSRSETNLSRFRKSISHSFALSTCSHRLRLRKLSGQPRLSTRSRVQRNSSGSTKQVRSHLAPSHIPLSARPSTASAATPLQKCTVEVHSCLNLQKVDL